jgi:hypothetical protein
MSAIPSSAHWPWPPSWAPQWLNQPINPNWTFAPLVQVTYANSKAPEVEKEVVGKHSYGRQLGRLMDAVEALAEAVQKSQPQLAKDDRIEEFRALAKKIEAIKEEARERRKKDLLDELKSLKKSDPDEWNALVRAVGR